LTILGIETSCDETAAAVVRDGREVLASVVHSQVPLHQPYGGVVPEIASRSHLERLPGVIAAALSSAECGVRNAEHGERKAPVGDPLSALRTPHSGLRTPHSGLRTPHSALRTPHSGLRTPHSGLRTPHSAFAPLDAIAVTYGPGLASSLLVGLNAAKGLALRLGKPLIGINHIEAHIWSVFLAPRAPALRNVEGPPPAEAFPLLALVVSGGHTCLVEAGAVGAYRVIGQTLDDAAGEAFDKAAQLLGLGYPGGPAVERAALAAGGRSAPIAFPQGRVRAGHKLLCGDLRAELCVSFSGLKTALLYHLRQHPPRTPEEVNAVAAAYQEAIVDALAGRCDRALRGGGYRALAVGGGVSLNRRLRERLAEVAGRRHVPLLLAEPRFCGDNAAMIAGLAGAGGGVRGSAALELDAVPSLAL
jgi:N6-L-threonylcarbamoyladenine synthase